MTDRTIAVEELAGRALSDVLRHVAVHKEALTVVLEDGMAVQIQPTAALEPLPVLQGFVPEGWKDAIYGE
jgi:hypothetical protein